MNFVGKIVGVVGTRAYKDHGRAQLKHRMSSGKQLVVVQPGHWLLDALCQYKREEHERLAREVSIDRVEQLSTLLAKNSTEIIKSSSRLDRIAEKTIALAAAYSRMLPDYEPLLVEVCVTKCLNAFTSSSTKSNDVGEFESRLRNELKYCNDDDWFECQFVLDVVDVLTLAPFFYKTQIRNPEIRQLISGCITDSRGNADTRTKLLMDRMAKDASREAFAAWTEWIEEEIATTGSPPCVGDSQGFCFLGPFVLNETELILHKHAYFPIPVEVDNSPVPYEQMNHIGIIEPKIAKGCTFMPGFIYYPPSTDAQ